MMVHGFDMYRVYLSTPGDLQKEMIACREAIAEVNKDLAMPAKILLVSVGLTSDDQITGLPGRCLRQHPAVHLFHPGLRRRLGTQESIPENVSARP